MGTCSIRINFSRKEIKKSLERKNKEQPRIAVDGTECTLRSANNKNLHRKLMSKLLEFQGSPKKDMSPKKQKLRETSGKYVSASERAQLIDEGIISKSESKGWKVESDEEDSDFDCYDKPDGKPVHVTIDKELAFDKPTLALLPNKSEEDEIHSSGKTVDGDGNISLC